MEKAANMWVEDGARALDFEQLSTGMRALSLLDSCCQDSLLAMGGMTALSYRRGVITRDELVLLARRLHAIRQEKQCRCLDAGQGSECAIVQRRHLH
jgi:hypothetical protein